MGEGRLIVLCSGKRKQPTELKSYKKSLVKLKSTGLLVLRNSILRRKRFEPKSCHTGGSKNTFSLKKYLQVPFPNIAYKATKRNLRFFHFLRTPTNAQKRLSVPHFTRIWADVAL